MRHVGDPPQHDEVDFERRLLGRHDAVDVGVLEHEVAPVEIAHVLHERHLEVQAGVLVDVDDLAQLELDRVLRLADGVDRLRRDEHQRDDEGEEGHGDSHFDVPSYRSRLRRPSRLRGGSAGAAGSGTTGWDERGICGASEAGGVAVCCISLSSGR